jgi:hypothetical protein
VSDGGFGKAAVASVSYRLERESGGGTEGTGERGVALQLLPRQLMLQVPWDIRRFLRFCACPTRAPRATWAAARQCRRVLLGLVVVIRDLPALSVCLAGLLLLQPLLSLLGLQPGLLGHNVGELVAVAEDVLVLGLWLVLPGRALEQRPLFGRRRALGGVGHEKVACIAVSVRGN